MQLSVTPHQRHFILVVEDNGLDARLISDAIQSAGIDAEIRFLQDGAAAIQLLDEIESNPGGRYPDLILVDLHLPRKRGDEVLAHLADANRKEFPPVLVVTSSDSETDRRRVKTLGAKGYFLKTSDYPEFMKLGVVVRSLLGNG